MNLPIALTLFRIVLAVPALLLGAADRRRVFGAQDGGRFTSFHVSKSPRTRLIRCYNRGSW